jgi:hypothetical protein
VEVHVVLGKRANPILLLVAALIIMMSLTFFGSRRVNGTVPKNAPMHAAQ